MNAALAGGGRSKLIDGAPLVPMLLMLLMSGDESRTHEPSAVASARLASARGLGGGVKTTMMVAGTWLGHWADMAASSTSRNA